MTSTLRKERHCDRISEHHSHQQWKSPILDVRSMQIPRCCAAGSFLEVVSACFVSVLAILSHFSYYRRISFTIGWQFEIQLSFLFHYIKECFQGFTPKMLGDALPCIREVLTRGWLWHASWLYASKPSFLPLDLMFCSVLIKMQLWFCSSLA